jgi:hypothetical protein
MSSVPSHGRFFPQETSDTALLIDSHNPRSTLSPLLEISAGQSDHSPFHELGVRDLSLSGCSTTHPRARYGSMMPAHRVPNMEVLHDILQ